MLERWSKNETVVTLLLNDCTHSLGEVRIVGVSYEEQSVTVELDDGTEEWFGLVDTEMFRSVNSEALAEYANLSAGNALAIPLPAGAGKRGRCHFRGAPKRVKAGLRATSSSNLRSSTL